MMGKKGDQDSQLPTNITKKRSCTDILCILLFVVFVGGWVGVGVLGFLHGDPEKLVFPSNSRGEICGRGDLASKPNLLFHDPSKCLTLGAIFGCSTTQVCVEKCPDKATTLYAYALYLKSGSNGPGNWIDFDINYQRQFCVPLTDDEWGQAVNDQSGDELLKLIDDRKCPSYTLESKPIVGRCLPDFGLVEGNGSNTIKDEEGNNVMNDDDEVFTGNTVKDILNILVDFLNARGFAERVWADLVTSKWMILAGMGVGVLLAFVWIILMRFIASIMVWVSMFATIGLLGMSAAYTWIKYDSFPVTKDQSETGITDVNPITDGFDAYLQIRDTWLALFIISLIIFVVVVLITLFLRKRILLAVALINESSKAVGSIMSSLFYPIISFLLQVVVMAWFVVVCIYLASSGQQEFNVINVGKDANCTETEIGTKCDPDNYNNTDLCECAFIKYGPNSHENYLQLYNLFGLFWGLCFVAALGEMVLAGAFSSWYWVLDKDDIPSFPVLYSFGRTLRYHTGTLAFGSLVIAIIKMIRTMLQYIHDKVKESGADNVAVKVILCLCKCCFWCLEKFMKFINRNAYILTAINGTNFCSSAREAFNLILRNCVRVVVLDKVVDFLLFLGKLVVTSTVTLLSFLYFSGTLKETTPLDVDEPDLNYYFVPIFIITIGVYFTASCFFSVYAMAVDTLFLCCLVDMEKNDGSREKPYFMSKSLRNILDLKQKKLKD